MSGPGHTHRVVILGSTGLLGRAMLEYARTQNIPVTGIARSGADVNIDAMDDAVLSHTLAELQPDTVINAIGITGLNLCESDPFLAWRVNARLVAMLAEICRESSSVLLHVSTDHFFSGDRDNRHSETAEVRLVNEYARSKYAGEAFALTYDRALVVRTNFTGYRGVHGAPSFAEWLLNSLRDSGEIVLFEDYYCSTIDTRSCSKALFDLLLGGHSGLVNVASRSVSSKKEFAEALAIKLGRSLKNVHNGKVGLIMPRRAESLGLDVSKAESLLGYELPGLDRTVSMIAEDLINNGA